MDQRHDSEVRRKLWEEDPERAARLAYLDVVALWHDQVVEGKYRGIPCFHRSSKSKRCEGATRPSRPSQYTPDPRAGVYEIPREVLDRWQRAA